MLETMRALPSPVVVPVVAGVDFPCSPAMVAMNTHVSQFVLFLSMRIRLGSL